MGYLRQKSTPSLVAGLAFGALYATSGMVVMVQSMQTTHSLAFAKCEPSALGYLMGTNAKYGVELATATSALLLASMAPRAANTRKPVPMLLTAMGGIGSAYYGNKLYQQMHGV